ncbi:MAG: hypothetical protein QOG26_377 [Solirubrobacterales bacterium]|nr:hypothetical protein [Solirubrobacterales bacterium]
MVLTLIDSLGTTGGGERLALELALAVDGERFERILCASRWSPAIAETELGAAALAALSDGGVEFIGLERSSKLALGPWLRLRRELRDRRVDVLHAHKFGSNLWGSIVGRAARVPVLVAHEHSWAYEGRPLRVLADRWLIGRSADALIAVSAADRRRMIEIERIPPQKARLIPNGMPPVPSAAAGDVRAELGIETGPVIGAVADLRPEKALDLLVRAAAQLAPRHPGLQLLIAGGGDQRELRALSAELGVGDAVHLLGSRGDVAAVLEALDVAVNCSQREGSSLAVMEYMEAALPVVATRVGGTPDLVEDGRTGLLVEPGDVSALAGAIGGLLDDPERARQMGERGRARRRAEFDMATMAGRIEALYDELLERKRGA